MRFLNLPSAYASTLPALVTKLTATRLFVYPRVPDKLTQFKRADNAELITYALPSTPP